MQECLNVLDMPALSIINSIRKSFFYKTIVRLFCQFGVLLIWLYCQNICATGDFSKNPEIKIFIQTLVKKHHFEQKKLSDLFATVTTRSTVMHHLTHPLETNPWNLYQRLFLSSSQLERGLQFWRKHQSLLARAEQQYGVPAAIIVATIGIESHYGHNNGQFRVIDTLTNLAFTTHRRRDYFKRELEEFLLLCREQRLDPYTLKGSYAGAIGQAQFMPSSYRQYGVNFSGNKQIDLINNEADAIGSIAYYYKAHGWQSQQPIAISAQIRSPGAPQTLLKQGWSNMKDIKAFAKLGVTSRENVSADLKARLIQLATGKNKQEYWLAFNNFKVIMRYNASTLYAMAVYQLSQNLASGIAHKA